MSLNIILTLFFFIFGTIIGSFLNVIILRYNTGRSALKGRSFCFNCGKTLNWSELVPVLSFLFQRGRCKNCGSKISWQYPLIEIINGLLYVLVFQKFSIINGNFVYLPGIIVGMITVSILLMITVYDIRQKIIPDEMIITLGFVALINISIAPIIPLNNFIAGFVLALPLFLISFLSGGRLMGMGDPKLVLVLGWLLGFVSGLSAVVLAFWIGAVYGLILMALSSFHFLKIRINRKTEIPFAPFLILGFFLVYFLDLDVLNLADLML